MKYPCPYCDRQLQEQSSLFAHLTDAHKVNIAIVSKEKFRKEDRHLEDETPVSDDQTSGHQGAYFNYCQICGKTFYKKKKFQSHTKVCQQKRLKSCTICGMKVMNEAIHFKYQHTKEDSDKYSIKNKYTIKLDTKEDSDKYTIKNKYTTKLDKIKSKKVTYICDEDCVGFTCQVCGETFHKSCNSKKKNKTYPLRLHMIEQHFKRQIYAKCPSKSTDGTYRCQEVDSDGRVCSFEASRRRHWAFHFGFTHKMVDRFLKQNLPSGRNTTLKAGHCKPSGNREKPQETKKTLDKIKSQTLCDEILKCQVCGRTFLESASTRKHMISQHFKAEINLRCPPQTPGVGTFKCQEMDSLGRSCLYETKHKGIWAMHYGNTHKMVDRFVKQYLENTERPQETGILDQSKSQTLTYDCSDEILNCQVCGKTFLETANTRKHMISQHFKSQINLRCPPQTPGLGTFRCQEINSNGKACSYETKHKGIWAMHYGNTHKRVDGILKQYLSSVQKI